MGSNTYSCKLTFFSTSKEIKQKESSKVELLTNQNKKNLLPSSTRQKFFYISRDSWSLCVGCGSTCNSRIIIVGSLSKNCGTAYNLRNLQLLLSEFFLEEMQRQLRKFHLKRIFRLSRFFMKENSKWPQEFAMPKQLKGSIGQLG